MVVEGNFSVRLVNAETKEPFKEHTGPDGNIYVEVEPGVDYFLETEVVGGVSSDDVYVFNFFVDGQKLNYYKYMAVAHGKEYNGIWSSLNGVETMKALSFEKPMLNVKKENGGSRTRPITSNDLIGKVEVKVYEGIFAYMYNQADFLADSLEKTTLSAELSQKQSKKVLRSKEGTESITEKISKPKRHYINGSHMATITLHYCTTVGLIRARVLPVPEGFWDEARILHPCKINSNRHAVDVKPTRIKVERKTPCGLTIGPPVEQDFFDFSDVLDSDDEDGEDDNNDENVFPAAVIKTKVARLTPKMMLSKQPSNLNAKLPVERPLDLPHSRSCLTFQPRANRMRTNTKLLDNQQFYWRNKHTPRTNRFLRQSHK